MTTDQQRAHAIVDIRSRITRAEEGIDVYAQRIRESVTDVEVIQYRETIEYLLEHIDWLQRRLERIASGQGI